MGTRYDKMTTAELDNWIRVCGQDLSDNRENYSPAKYALVAEIVRGAAREKLRRIRHENWIRQEMEWETERAIRGGTGWTA